MTRFARTTVMVTVGLLTLSGTVLAGHSASAQVATVTPLAAPPAYRVIARERATTTQTLLELETGRSTAIDFSPTQERILFVKLADPSRTTYVANKAIESGQATTLFLTPIQALSFPGATTNAVTTLLVQTVDAANNQRLYSFNLQPVEVAKFTGVVITPIQKRPTVKRLQPKPVAVRPQIDPASLDIERIERGLTVALDKGYTPESDPIVAKVRRVIASVRVGQSLSTAAILAQVPLDVLAALDKLGKTQPQTQTKT
jgi:hypothetical protein